MERAQASVGEAQFSLIFRGESLPFDDISARMGLQPTTVIRRGDLLNRLPRIEATADEWVHAIPLTNPEGADDALNDLLETVCAHRTELNALESSCQVTLRLYVQSDRAQIAYRLMPETLQKLVATALPLDLTSLSWGEIGI